LSGFRAAHYWARGLFKTPALLKSKNEKTWNSHQLSMSAVAVVFSLRAFALGTFENGRPRLPVLLFHGLGFSPFHPPHPLHPFKPSS
jgi:hypothetical protein